MTAEEKFVVRPLVRWFERQNAQWKLYRPRYSTSATGWDLEAKRKGSYLLVEAKYIDGPFLASFGGLVVAPLAHRMHRFMRRKRQSEQRGVCWAIGTNYTYSHLYQILLDYFARSPAFWRHYARNVRMKYIFFVRRRRVARAPFADVLKLAEVYRTTANGKKLSARQTIAGDLMTGLLRFG